MVGNATCIVENNNGLSLAARSVRLGAQQAWQCKPTEADASAPAYPDGPYGNRMGSVLANLTWQGYVNPTGEAVSNTLPYTTTSLQALRGSGRGYAMVHVSEFL